MSSIGQLARALVEARHDLDQILRALASTLTDTLCDACAIWLPEGTAARTPYRTDPRDQLLARIARVPADGVHSFDTAKQARAQLPTEYCEYVDRFSLRGLLITSLTTTPRGTVIATRDGNSLPFTAQERAAIQACVELASIAADGALQVTAERAAVAAERERITRFQHELIRIVGHDLRAPLGAIVIGTELLATASDPAVAIARIVSFTKRLSRIVDHVVDLTRTRLGGGIPLARCDTRLAPLLKSAVAEIAAANPQHRIALAGVEEVRGLWDQDRIEQVVVALLSNAVQYGRERGTVEVELSHDGGAVTITVHNELQGRPVSPAALATMFDAYRRGSDDEHIGTGIGLSLYLAQQIMRAHGGTITVESSPSGTAFHVVLPGRVLIQ